MTVQRAEYLYSPEEYLRLERAAQYKSEYLDGRIYAMAGGSRSHAIISANVTVEVGTRLKKRPCHLFGSDMRVEVDTTGLFTYPDLSVVCGDEQYLDGMKPDTLLNPVLLVEVLSDSTERYDRGMKFDHYRQIPSLREYLLVSQNQPQVQSFLRQCDDGRVWLVCFASGLDESIELKSIDVSLALADIYDKVEFPTGPISVRTDEPPAEQPAGQDSE